MVKGRKTKQIEAYSPLDSLGSHRHIKQITYPLIIKWQPIVEMVYFTRIGHNFGLVPPIPGAPPTPPMYFVQDFLLDQTGASGADGRMSPTTQFDLTKTATYRFNILPQDSSKRIIVVPNSKTAKNWYMDLDLGRVFLSAVSDYADQHPTKRLFCKPSGPPPTISYNGFFIGHNTNHCAHFRISADLISKFSFSGFTAIGSYPFRTFDPGTKSYVPYSESRPIGLPAQQFGVPYMMFGYETSNSTDPGSFVFLE